MKSNDVLNSYAKNTVISEKCNYIPIFCDVCGCEIPQKSQPTIIENNTKPEFKPIETEYFDCDCHSSDHTIRFIYTPAEIDWKPELHVEVQLCRTKNIFQRILSAIKYIFGYECRYGHWDCTLIQAKDLERLRDLAAKTHLEYCKFMIGKNENT
jgi:hypothetical protein